METILFVNACMRGEPISRTYAVAQRFLAAYRKTHPQALVEEADLTEEPPACLTGEDIARRDSLLKQGAYDDSSFAPARRFAAADKIVIAAPYWDLSFPASLKAYFERLCVNGITWRYTEDGTMKGLCRAKKLVYITTSGGKFPEELLPLTGTAIPYIKGLCAMFGIPDFSCLWTQGLDIQGADAADLLESGMREAEQAAWIW